MGYRLAVITNGGSDIQSRRLAFSGLDRHVDALVTSSDVNIGKPDARIFDHALQRLGVSAEEAWMVGDSLESDVGGALNAGMTGVWFNPEGAARKPAQPEAHHVIASLTELEGLLP